MMLTTLRSWPWVETSTRWIWSAQKNMGKINVGKVIKGLCNEL